MNHRERILEFILFVVLVAIGVAGRWFQPAWNFTPLAAVAVVGGYCFRSFLQALLLTVCVLVVSDVILPAHSSVAVQLSVYGVMVLPLVLGRWARHSQGRRRVVVSTLCVVLPATAFYLVTNFVHWLVTDMYDKTLSGLSTCYIAAAPFYRSMLAGDVFYLLVLGGCLALVNVLSHRTTLAVRRYRSTG